jgi:hypothetical protein
MLETSVCGRYRTADSAISARSRNMGKGNNSQKNDKKNKKVKKDKKK